MNNESNDPHHMKNKTKEQRHRKRENAEWMANTMTNNSAFEECENGRERGQGKGREGKDRREGKEWVGSEARQGGEKGTRGLMGTARQAQSIKKHKSQLGQDVKR